MRNTPMGILLLHRGFGSRRGTRAIIWSRVVRVIRHRMSQASDRAMGVQMRDLHVNPFLYIIESRG